MVGNFLEPQLGELITRTIYTGKFYFCESTSAETSFSRILHIYRDTFKSEWKSCNEDVSIHRISSAEKS